MISTERIKLLNAQLSKAVVLNLAKADLERATKEVERLTEALAKDVAEYNELEVKLRGDDAVLV